MIRIGLLPILLPVVFLPLSACSSADTEHYVALLTGTPDPSPQAYVAPVVEVEQASAPVEPPCVPGTSTYMWRFYDYDSCTNALIGPTPGYW